MHVPEQKIMVALLTILENIIRVFSQKLLDFTFDGVVNLIDGVELINKLAEYHIRVRKIKD